jgi:predicted NAD/FAD-binding protein
VLVTGSSYGWFAAPEATKPRAEYVGYAADGSAVGRATICRGNNESEEYVDNGFSAYSGKPRWNYLRMLDDLASGPRDGVPTSSQGRAFGAPPMSDAATDSRKSS